MAKLFEMKQQREAALARAEGILIAAEKANRAMTPQETATCDTAMAEVHALNPQIQSIERENTIMGVVRGGKILPGGPRSDLRPTKRVLSADYAHDFYTMVRTNGKECGSHLAEGSDGFGGFALPAFSTPSAALGESTNSAGGFAVPSMVDLEITPLAPQEMAVRQLSLVFPTTMDIRVPRKGAFGAASAKAEGATFTENDPTLEQFTLSAFMAGNLEKISWELAQDVPAFQSFCVTDSVIAQQMYEENLYINGTGSGQAQGLIGNVGAGVTCGTHAYSDILDSTFDVMGALNAVYHRNASFLMQRATAIGIRKAQKQANLFEPVFVREGGQDFLHGYPVAYSASMPAVAAAAKPILFGDFKQGYVIGDRGGSGINVKILDQPFAINGQIALLVYRRTDGRVRRSEAIQTLALT